MSSRIPQKTLFFWIPSGIPSEIPEDPTGIPLSIVELTQIFIAWKPSENLLRHSSTSFSGILYGKTQVVAHEVLTRVT